MYAFSLVGYEKLWFRSALLYAKLRARIQVKSLCRMGKYLKYVNQTYNLSNKTCSSFLSWKIHTFHSKVCQAMSNTLECELETWQYREPVLAQPPPALLPPSAAPSCTAGPHTHIGEPASHPCSVPTPSNSPSGLQIHTLEIGLSFCGWLQSKGLCRLWIGFEPCGQQSIGLCILGAWSRVKAMGSGGINSHWLHTFWGGAWLGESQGRILMIKCSHLQRHEQYFTNYFHSITGWKSFKSMSRRTIQDRRIWERNS